MPAIEVNGGKAVVVSLRYPDYAVPWDEVRAAITPRTRMIMLNSPHNPAAVDPRRRRHRGADARASRAPTILIVSDEVYEHIIFDGARHESMARYEELRARSFIVGSFGKTYHVTGWKVGYVVAPAALTTEFRKVHQFVTFSTNTPIQYALAEFLSEKRGYPELSAFYQRKRDLFLRADRRLALEAAAVARHLLPAARLLGDHRREGHGLRAAPDEGARRRVDPDVGVPLQAAGAAGAAVLFREEGRDAASRRPAAIRGSTRRLRHHEPAATT